MAWLKYYRDEEARHPGMHRAGIIFEDAVEMIERFAKEYEIGEVEIERTSGNRISHWNGSTIRLNTDHLNVLLVLHEFAHALVDHNASREVVLWRKRREAFCREMMEKMPQAPGLGSAGPLWRFHDEGGVGAGSNVYRRWERANPCPVKKKGHTSVHAEFVDILVRKVVERGWATSIAIERGQRDLAKHEERKRRVAYAADPKVIREKKIERRKAQIAKLEAGLARWERNIRSTNTRLAKARRSLAALERAAKETT